MSKTAAVVDELANRMFAQFGARAISECQHIFDHLPYVPAMLLRRLRELGQPSRLDFQDPDYVIDIETVGEQYLTHPAVTRLGEERLPCRCSRAMISSASRFFA